MKFHNQPSNAQHGHKIAPVVVELNDPNSTADVTLSLHGTPSKAYPTSATSAKLGGKLKVKAIAGKATFDDLSVNQAGANYYLKALCHGENDHDSNKFDIS